MGNDPVDDPRARIAFEARRPKSLSPLWRSVAQRQFPQKILRPACRAGSKAPRSRGNGSAQADHGFLWPEKIPPQNYEIETISYICSCCWPLRHCSGPMRMISCSHRRPKRRHASSGKPAPIRAHLATNSPRPMATLDPSTNSSALSKPFATPGHSADCSSKTALAPALLLLRYGVPGFPSSTPATLPGAAGVKSPVMAGQTRSHG